MSTLAPSVFENLAGRVRLTFGTLIDAVVIIVLSFQLYPLLASSWESLSGRPVEPPLIGFMSDYSEPAQNGYWLIIQLSIVVAAFLNATSTMMFGASIGKAATGVRFVSFDGGKPPLSAVLKKTLFNVGLFLIAAMPGPVVGFIFGSKADTASMVLLLLAGALALVLGVIPAKNGLLAAYRWAGIAPVIRKQFS